MKTIVTLTGAALISLFASGCAQVMAVKQPKPFTPASLTTGTPRTAIVAEVGQPVTSETHGDRLMDAYKYVDGGKKNSGGAKAARVVLYTAGDIFTAWLDQVIWMPAEMLGFAGTDHAVTVDYVRSEGGPWVAKDIKDTALKGRSTKKESF